MKLLIVDDTHTKVELIAKAIPLTGVPVQLTHETNAMGARQRLQREEFDLLLIDLQLPDMAGAKPNPKGGLDFFDLLLTDPETSLPAEILFVTSEGSLVESGRAQVERRGSGLCVISAAATDWLDIISGQMKIAARRVSRRVQPCDFAVITALASELDAVLRLDYHWEEVKLKGDPSTYHRGRFESSGFQRTVIAASALQKGMASSAALANKLVLKFQPKLLAMTGICAGVRGKVGLGDVVVGNPTWDWGSGKHAETDNGSAIFKLAPKQSDLPVGLATLCEEIGRSESFRRSVRAGWDRPFPTGEFRCHVGPMASGASVIASAPVGEEIARQNKDLIAIEMEAYAVMVAAQYATMRPMYSVAIKSVCDFADAKKDDDWQPYAAYTSALFADELFRRFFLDRH